MNKKIVVCVILVNFTISLLTKFALAEEDSDNAAIYYNKAFELCSYSHESPLHKKVDDVVKNGWVDEGRGLEELLKQNEVAIAEFEKGIKLEKCDFTFGRQYDNFSEIPVANFKKSRELANLIILEGRLFENKGKILRAIKQYLSVLTFAQHISQDKILVSVMIAKNIENMAFSPIQQYLEKGKFNLQLCKEILTFLQNIESKKSTLAEAMGREKEMFLWAGRQQIFRVNKKMAESINKLDEQQITKASVFLQDIEESHKSVGNKYCAFLIQFAQTNSEIDKQNFENELTSLRNKYPIGNKSFDENMQRKMYIVYGEPFNGTKEIADILAEMVALISLPNLVKTPDIYYIFEAKFRILKVAAAIRIYATEKNKLPDTLSELVPEYLISVPIDPWSQQTLKYVKTDKKWFLYSFGPDRKDNNGVGTGYEISPKELEGKDIGFSVVLDND